MKLIRMIAVTPVLLAACASEPASRTEDQEEAARKAAYEKCLEDNMAVAMAWEAIEAQCRREAGLEEDPLGEKPVEGDPLEGKPEK